MIKEDPKRESENMEDLLVKILEKLDKIEREQQFLKEDLLIIRKGIAETQGKQKNMLVGMSINHEEIMNELETMNKQVKNLVKL